MAVTIKATIFPPGYRPQNEPDVVNHAQTILFYWLHLLLQTTHIHPLPHYFDLNYPYLTIPIIKGPIPEELVWYLWALSAIHTCAIAFPAYTIYHYLCNADNEDTPLATLFKMCAPLPHWRGRIYQVLERNNLWTAPLAKQKKFYYFFSIYREYYQSPGQQLMNLNRINLWRTVTNWPSNESLFLKRIGPYLVNVNQPDEDEEARAYPLYIPKNDPADTQDSQGFLALQEFQSEFIRQGISYSQGVLAGESQDLYIGTEETQDIYTGIEELRDPNEGAGRAQRMPSDALTAIPWLYGSSDNEGRPSLLEADYPNNWQDKDDSDSDPNLDP